MHKSKEFCTTPITHQKNKFFVIRPKKRPVCQKVSHGGCLSGDVWRIIDLVTWFLSIIDCPKRECLHFWGEVFMETPLSCFL